MAVQVSDFDRFSFTLFIALALHAFIVLMVSFAPEEPVPAAETLEITLSQFDDDDAPDDADFLAATSQKGSGTEEEKQELTTTQQAPVQSAQIQEVQPEPVVQQEAAEDAPKPEKSVVTTTAKSRPVSEPEDEIEPKEEAPKQKKSLMDRSLEIASLEARLDQQKRAYAKKPRILRVTAASTLKSDNAWYVQNWVSKVTRVGNINYPPEARRSGLYGSLRMVVVIERDGSVKDVEILNSSGSKVLDDAAIRIVRLSAPFAPFPPEMREDVDQLEIIRTWSFERRGLSSG
ncbi:MAG: energy transducer TonB [Alteromonadaceae bacterium]|uniref:TonB family protein n=1 Tax=Marinobacter sp. V034 TaxID=3459610 RepID=UPI000C5556E2|nr:energy transducer TonB [Alteromonadaceae bacterium]MBH86528.1 energy transducer TonB [Alteromonadaceae bacterium]|tara:strand:+ start:10746 stop:11612 length:867 start_codon:yes stop_codon:yes gene_type:complete